MISRRALIAAGVLLPAGAAAAYVVPRYLEDRRRHRDYPVLGHYAEDNRKLLASGLGTGIVFLGDSITAYWPLVRPGFFTPGRVGRGIPSQTTPQMLLRTMQDVVHLKPRCLHLMGGTNDIAGMAGPMTVGQTIDNLRAIIDVAQAHRIDVLLGSVPMTNRYRWQPMLDVLTPVREINAWFAANAQALGVTWVDYAPVLADASGAIKPGLSNDDLHPTEQGYIAMESILEPLLKARGV